MSSSTTHPIMQSTESTQESVSGLDSISHDDNDAAPSPEEFSSPQRPLRIYTRPQLLLLSQSPMVKLPPDMPELKVWFGTENENLMNKKDEQSAPNSTRERRFRRDAEDGDTSSRPTFRSTLQPSQMGNFKHQSLRDRDRDREGEKDRDIRDKEGHERLRHLSDKFDRDRLLPLSSSRNKDRDSAPHINSSNTRNQTTLPSNGTSRRADAREGTKKKVGESTEDWRRGSDPRPPREERSENGRRDREDRDRARSRPRESSRSKRDTSASRRDEPRERARDRDRDDRRDPSRPRRDREEDDDPRHWRDDGKRDERMAARRERERARNQDRESDDRRWVPGDDREGSRYKRTTARDRKSGNAGDDGRDKDDRREKEKEPAWMDTYIPNESSSGILGGQAPNGELDGIQAWKKGLKEKEVKDNNGATNVSSSKTTADLRASPSDLVEKPLDEIQIFRMLMKKEEDKKRLEGSATAVGGEINSNKENDAGRQPHQRGVINEDDLGSAQVKSSLPPLEPTSAPLDAASTQSLKDPAVLASVKVNMDPLDRSVVPTRVAPTSVSSEFIAKPSSDSINNSPFPPVGSRVLAMKNKAAVSSNPPLNLQSLNGGLQNIIQESPQHFVKNEPMRSHPGFSPFDDPNRPAYPLDDTRDLSMPLNQANASQRLPIDQLFNGNMNPQSDTNYNNSLNKGSRLAKIFEGKARDMSVPPSKPQMQGSYVSPSPSQSQRQELGSFGGHGNTTHSMEELVAMLSNSSQRNNLGPQSGSSQLLNSNSTFNNHVPSHHSLQQHQLPSTRLEPLYESRTEDRSFMPDGMVPGLRSVPPPPRTRDGLGHFNDTTEDQLHYNLQRLAQQQQGRSLDPLFNGPAGPLFNQQSGRHGVGGLPLQSLQQAHYRGGPSPALNTTNPPQQQRLPPGLANLGGRPPHDPSQFIGLQSLPALGAQHNNHGNGPIPQQQLPFNNYNVTNPVGLNAAPHRGPSQNSLLQSQQLPLGNLGHHSLDPRLSNHHHMMGIGGSGIAGNRINGQFPPQQAPVGPNHVGIRPQQQPQLLPQMLPHLMPHMQQQGPSPSTNPQNHDLMAVLMGGALRE